MSIVDAINAMNADDSQHTDGSPPDSAEPSAGAESSAPQADPHSSNQEAVDAIMAALNTGDPNALIQAMTGMVDSDGRGSGEDQPGSVKR